MSVSVISHNATSKAALGSGNIETSNHQQTTETTKKGMAQIGKYSFACCYGQEQQKTQQKKISQCDHLPLLLDWR